MAVKQYIKYVTVLFLVLRFHASNGQTVIYNRTGTGRRYFQGDMHFTLHTRSNPNGSLITKSTINNVPKKKTVLLIPNWDQDTSNRSYFRNLTDIYLNTYDINIIQTHADRALRTYLLPYVDHIGKHVGDLLVELDRKNRVLLNQVHLIGIIVGSHIAGVAATSANSQIQNRKVERISALSPSHTDFKHGFSIRQLRSSDARKVDVYVTSAKGLHRHIGNVTFYVNGGVHQPLCPPCDFGRCDEMRSVLLYMYTIGMKISGTICDSYNHFLTKRCKDKYSYFGDSYVGHVTGKAYNWMYCWAHKKCRYQN